MQDSVQFACLGLIPACAGKTLTFPAQRTPRWAHPRVCGENIRDLAPVFQNIGSSPRVRGKPLGNRVPGGIFGLIPACAGKTPSSAALASI